MGKDWGSENTEFIILVLGMLGIAFGGLATFLLKSRCSRLRCCCIECERNTIDLTASTAHIDQRSTRV